MIRRWGTPRVCNRTRHACKPIYGPNDNSMRQGVGALNTNFNGFDQNGNMPFIQNGTVNSGTVLSGRELRRQNYSALHANYKTRNSNTDIVRMPVGGTDRVQTAGAQRAARNVP